VSLLTFYKNQHLISQKNADNNMIDKKELVKAGETKFQVSMLVKDGKAAKEEHLLFRFPLTSNFQHKPQTTSIRDRANLLSYLFKPGNESRFRKIVSWPTTLPRPSQLTHRLPTTHTSHINDSRQPWREREDATQLDHDLLEFSLPKNKEIPNIPRSGDV
jgi:hypothetical protein